MIVQVRYLGQLRQAVGRSSEAVEVEEGCTVAVLVARLTTERPELCGVLSSPAVLIFVRDEQARPTRVLGEGDEIIFMTPISGGEPESVFG